MQAYCVKCRAKREMKNAKSITMKNGKPATQGVCPTCGTKMFRIGKSSCFNEFPSHATALRSLSFEASGSHK